MATIPPPFDICTLLWCSTSRGQNFTSLLEIAFGLNIAFAALIETGHLQIRELANFARQTHDDAVTAHKLLTVEGEELMKNIPMDGNKVRCENHVSGYTATFQRLIPRFVAFALAATSASVFFLVVIAFHSNIEVSDLFSLMILLVLFFPVPAGLYWIYDLVGRAESEIRAEYADLFAVKRLIKDRLKNEALQAIEKIEEGMQVKKKSWWKKLVDAR